MKKFNDDLKRNIGMAFLILLIPFVLLAILSIWDFVGPDVIGKSISTIAVLAVATLVSVGIISLVNNGKK